MPTMKRAFRPVVKYGEDHSVSAGAISMVALLAFELTRMERRE